MEEDSNQSQFLLIPVLHWYILHRVVPLYRAHRYFRVSVLLIPPRPTAISMQYTWTVNYRQTALYWEVRFATNVTKNLRPTTTTSVVRSPAVTISIASFAVRGVGEHRFPRAFPCTSVISRIHPPQFVGGLPISRRSTANNYNPVVRDAFGIKELKPETSLSFSSAGRGSARR